MTEYISKHENTDFFFYPQSYLREMHLGSKKISLFNVHLLLQSDRLQLFNTWHSAHTHT